MIELCRQITAGFWLVFCIIWLVAALGAKRNIVRRPWWLRLPVRIAIALIVLPIFFRFFRGELFNAGLAAGLSSPATAVAGMILCALGLGYAVWGRMALGANWGMPMTLKEGHELVTSGPYAHVRHPIYSGIMLAMLGSVLVFSVWWLAILVVNAVQFVYAAKREEQLMLCKFADAYAEYRRRTWMLIPFVL